MHEDQFLPFFIQFMSDCEEARADIEDRYERLLQRLEITEDDERTELLREFLFNDYNPL